MTEWLPIDFITVLAAIFAVAALPIYKTVGKFGFRRRQRLTTIMDLGFMIAIVVLYVRTLTALGVEWNESLSVVNVTAALLIAYLGPRNRVDGRAKVSIELIILSKAKFNMVIRKALMRSVANLPVAITDDFAVGTEYENHDAFLPVLRSAGQKGPDYVIAMPPSKEKANSAEFRSALNDAKRSARRVIVLENRPDVLDEYRGTVTEVYSDSTRGAEILAKYAARFVEAGGNVVLLNGPPYSENACVRAGVYASVFEERHASIERYDLPGWSEEGTYDRTRQYLASGRTPRVILCGNDTMALGAVRAVSERRLAKDRRPKVFGYDGIPRALIAIADKESAFFGTISISPAQYGMAVADLVISEVTKGKANVEPFVKLMVDETSLVTKESADNLLERF